MVGRRVLENPVDHAGPVEADHHRQPPRHGRGPEPADLLQPPHVHLHMRAPHRQGFQVPFGAPGQVDPQVRLGACASHTCTAPGRRASPTAGRSHRWPRHQASLPEAHRTKSYLRRCARVRRKTRPTTRGRSGHRLAAGCSAARQRWWQGPSRPGRTHPVDKITRVSIRLTCSLSEGGLRVAGSDQLSAVFSALADPTRRAILAELV